MERGDPKSGRDDPDEKWDQMSGYEMVLARQVPEPEWYPTGLFGVCISRSPKQNRSNMWQARQKIGLARKVPLPGSEMSRYPGRLLARFAQDIKSKKISNDQELIQSDPISCPQNQKENN